MNEIELNFVNNSNDTFNSQIVIFQKNVAVPFGDITVAWKVIKNCGPGSHHRFSYGLQTYVAVSDSWGNYSPHLPADYGEQFSVVNDSSRDVLKATGAASKPNEIEIVNALPSGSVNANIYRTNLLLDVKTSVAPGQKTAFSFVSSIWIGAVSQLEQGEIMDSAVVTEINTEMSLIGIKSADIVMTGGGPGPGSTPFVFTLRNIIYA
jgi:hypothetical protein